MAWNPYTGALSADLRQEWTQLRAYVGLTDPRGEVVDDVCLRTVLPQARETPIVEVSNGPQAAGGGGSRG